MKQDNLNLVRDEQERVRAINHNQAPVTLDAATPRELGQAYLREVADIYQINTDQMGNLDAELQGDVDLEEQASFRWDQEKEAAGNTAVSYMQTYFNLPVRQAGLDVVMQNNPLRVLNSSASFYPEIAVERPQQENLERFRQFSAEDLAKLLRSGGSEERRDIKINQTRFVIYRYEAKKRQFVDTAEEKALEPLPTLPLPDVPEGISDGNFYVVLEVYFTMPLENWDTLNWLALIEVETGAILLLRAIVAHAQGYVFLHDPVTESGITTNAPNSNEMTLSGFQDNVTLQGLNSPNGAGVQSLAGSLVTVSSSLATPPTTTSPFEFFYPVRTNNFSAVNAYHNCDRFFRLISDLGINRATYLGGTSFPVSVNHRFGSSVNANCPGDAAGDGIGAVNFELADSSDTTNPLGVACDWPVVLHEIGGHGILYDHIQNGQWWLGFAHSQGDSFAAILNDPESALTGAERFVTFPFSRFWDESFATRRHDRDVASGWGWGGSMDNNFGNGYHGYQSESILATIIFRLYRSMGGDAATVNQKRFASRFAAFILLTTVGSLTSTSAAAIDKTSQTDYAPVTDYEARMETADLATFTPATPPGTHTGGAYHKVIRWAFEKQGLFRAAGAAVTAEGSPPPVDVYINDGRNGEYQYLANHWSCTDIWNRTSMGAGGGVHEEPIVGATNYAYVRIKNRGSQMATNVVVAGFHCRPGIGLTYPVDWEAMTDATLTAPDLAANDNVGVVVGPFRWTPSQEGHECMFFSVSAAGDASNIDARITGSIPEWRLVPHDNNIAQRNVAPVPGARGAPGLKKAFKRRKFWLKNTFSHEAEIKLVATLPKFLTERGWRLEFASKGGDQFRLAGEKSRKIIMNIKAGEKFSKETVLANADDSVITVTGYADDIIIGGMSYYIDPNLRVPGAHTDDDEGDDRPDS